MELWLRWNNLSLSVVKFVTLRTSIGWTCKTFLYDVAPAASLICVRARWQVAMPRLPRDCQSCKLKDWRGWAVLPVHVLSNRPNSHKTDSQSSSKMKTGTNASPMQPFITRAWYVIANPLTLPHQFIIIIPFSSNQSLARHSITHSPVALPMEISREARFF